MPGEESRYRHSVRITLDDIYREHRDLRLDVKGLKQSMDEFVKPQLADNRQRLATLELRMYAILAGLIAAFGAGKGLGVL